MSQDLDHLGPDELRALVRTQRSELATGRRQQGDLQRQVTALDKEVQVRGVRLSELGEQLRHAERERDRFQQNWERCTAPDNLGDHTTRAISTVVGPVIKEKMREATELPDDGLLYGFAFNLEWIVLSAREVRKAPNGEIIMSHVRAIRAAGRRPVVIVLKPMGEAKIITCRGVLSIGYEDEPEEALAVEDMDLRALLAEEAHAH